jgi:inosose dehydratase
VLAAPGDIRFGYAAITWQGQDRQAIDDVAAVGFKGFSCARPRCRSLATSPPRSRTCSRNAARRWWRFRAATCGIEPEFEAEDLATHVKHARFVRDAGGRFCS